MDHDYIASHQIVERYVTRRLSDDESAGFEEHMIDCPQCQEELSIATDMKRGLEEAAGTGAWKHLAENGFGAWIRKAFAFPAPAWALAGILITLLPAWMLMQSIEQRNAQLRSEIAQLRDRPVPPVPSSAVGVPIVSLSLSRGVGDGKEPIPQIQIAPGQPAIVLGLEYVRDPNVKSYRATIEKADHTQVAEINSLSPASSDTIGVQVQSQVLTPGRYSVILAGTNASGRSGPLGRFDFEVAP